MVKFGVVVFPGSNCDHDAYYSIGQILGYPVNFLWHKDTDLKGSDVVVLPGGFSYGDYLRSGAIARFSPIMRSVINFADKGGIVLGICNGFQILLEAGLLPGVMFKNKSLQFVCRDVYLSVENKNTIFSGLINGSKSIKIPVAHGEGNYYCDNDTLKMLQDNEQIVFRYASENGEVAKAFNPNGSTKNIAGIINKAGNILGLMPHPERVCNPVLNNTDGQLIFRSIVNHLNN